MLKKRLSKILQYIPFVLLMCAIILVATVIVSIKNNKTPSLFGYSMFLVVSPSMEDTIMTGDLIFVNTKADDYQVGDIITFHKPDDDTATVTHRIVQIDISDEGEVYYTTKGDNNSQSYSFETHFSESYMIGKYASKSSFLGEIYRFIYQGGINLIYGSVVLIFLTIGISEAVSIVKEINKQKMNQVQEEKDKLLEIQKQKMREEIEKELTQSNQKK